MKTKNILILSIVLTEILFLSFSSTYELPAIDTEEMKAAVKNSIQEETKRLQYLEKHYSEKACESIVIIDRREMFHLSENDKTLKNILSSSEFYWYKHGDIDNHKKTILSFDFNKPHEKEFIKNRKIRRTTNN